MSAMTLDQWNAQFGGDVDYSQSSRKQGGADAGGRITPELDVAYPVTVKAAKVVTSGRGDVQLQLSMDVFAGGHDGEKAGTLTEWVTLPMQESDAKMDKETVRKLTLRRRDDLIRILSKALPATFALYATKTGEGKTAKYTDFNGAELSKDGLNAREIEINKAAMAFAADLHNRVGETVDEVVGAEIFIAKALNEKNPKYPYTNFYGTQPKKLPLFEG